MTWRGWAETLVPPRVGAAAGLEPAVVVWLVGAMAAATAPFVPDLPPWVTLAALAVATWRLHPWSRARALPRLVRLAAIPALLLVLALTGSIGFGVEEAAPFFVGFLWLKLVEVDNPRDVVVASAFGVFLIASRLLAEQSFVATAWGLLCLTGFLSVCVRLHAPRHPWATLRGAALLVLYAMPVAALLFIVAPRPPLHLAYQVRGQAVSGVSDQLRPGDIAKVALDDTAIFSAEQIAGRPWPPEAIYWRQATLWWTDGARWTRGSVSGAGQPRILPGDGDRSVFEVLAVPSINRLLPAPDRPLGPPEGATQGADGSLALTRSTASPVAYAIAADAAARLQEADGDLVRLGLQLPSEVRIDPEVVALALRWRAAGGAASDLLDEPPGPFEDPRAAVARAAIADAGLRHLATGGYRYTLDPGLMGDGLARTLLFERKAGFCGHYSSAYALVLRLARVPARIVVGYRGAEPNPIDGRLVVRGRMAHAWVEAWIGPEEGWRRIDPTAVVPGGTDEERAATGAPTPDAPVDRPGRLRLWREWMEMRWYRMVLSFDQEVQLGLLQSVGLGPLGVLGPLALTVIAVALLAVFGRWLALRRREAGDPALRPWRRLVEHGSAHGVVPRADEAPRTLAERLSLSAPPDAADPIRRAASACARLRYDPRLPAAERDRLRDELASAVDEALQRWPKPS